MLFLFCNKKSYDHILTKKYLEIKIRSLRKNNSLKIYADNIRSLEKNTTKITKIKKRKNLGNSIGHILNNNNIIMLIIIFF